MKLFDRLLVNDAIRLVSCNPKRLNGTDELLSADLMGAVQTTFCKP
ncbi:MAG TPA: hypothetical protein VFV39_01470 [Limnobacter sp.]|nr:hypothetical protein [Limnobacter sp.]